MNLQKSQPSESPVVIYPAQSVTTLISRAWNVVKLNWKSSLLIMLGPTLLYTLLAILLSLATSQTFLTPAPGSQLILKLVTALLSVIIGILGYFYSGLANCALVRLYYSAIVQEQPLSAKACGAFILRNWAPLVGLMCLVIVPIIVFIVIDFLIISLGVLMGTAALGVLGSYAVIAQSVLKGIMVVFFMLLWGCVVLTVSISLISFEGFFLVFPFMALSTAPSDQPLAWPRRIGAAYRLLLNNMPRAILFALALFGFGLVMSSVLNVPAFLWMWLEMTRLGLSQQHHAPLHVNIILNLWSSATHLILTPFYISAVTLFWYDCQVRKEGLDLRLWFENLVRRRNHRPMDGSGASPSSAL